MFSVPVDPTPSFFGGGWGSPSNHGYGGGAPSDDEGASEENAAGNGGDRYRKNVEKFLYQFGQKGLKPPDSYIAEGKEMGQQVFLKLQKHSNFKIAEPHFAGSIGKKTDVIEPDLDLVVVLVDCRPPFGSVLKDFENLLELYQEELKIRPNSIECKTRFSLQFVFQNGIEVDLLPAAKLEPEEIYELLQKEPKDYYQYSSSLVQRQLGFMRSHPSSFVHIVIRLAKFWFKSLSFGDKKVYGGSTMMELIGIAAAGHDEATYDGGSVLRAFAGVLDMVSRLERLKLAFRESSSNVWERVPEIELRSKGTPLIPGVVGTAEILNRDCFIIEPANPYNDLLGDKAGVMSMLMGFAQETRLRLSNLMDKKYATLNDQTNVMDLGIMKVFEPQPPNLKATFPSGVPRDFQISYSQPCSSLSCGMKVRNEEPLKRKEVQLAVEAIKRNLFTVVNAAAEAISASSSSGGNSNISVRQAVDDLIKKNLQTELKTSDNDREEDMDVTLSIPYEIGGKRYAVKFSMRWE